MYVLISARLIDVALPRPLQHCERSLPGPINLLFEIGPWNKPDSARLTTKPDGIFGPYWHCHNRA